MKTIVLGGGLVGMTTAWYLAKEGHEVTVIDRQPAVAAECSFANAGLVAPGHALTWASPRAPRILLNSLFKPNQPLQLKFNPDPRMLDWGLRFLGQCTTAAWRRNTLRKLKLCSYSQDSLQALAAETGIDYDATRKGLLYCYRDQASLERGIANMTILRDNGRRMEFLDAAGVVKVEPALADSQSKIAGGIYCPDDESGDGNKFSLALRGMLEEKFGATFQMETTIMDFQRSGDRVHGVVTDKGLFMADNFVLALGSFSPFLARKLGIFLPIYPVKGYSLTFPVKDDSGAPDVGGVDENNLVAWCRMGDRFRLTATAEFSGYDTSHKPEDFAGMTKVARDLFPRAADYDKPSYWACLRPMTPEGTPIFGRGRHRNFWLNTGQGHMGWTMSCGSARIAVDLMHGRKPGIDTEGMIHQP